MALVTSVMAPQLRAGRRPMKTRIWLGTIFIEDGRTIDLNFIGMIRDDGAVYYAEAVECKLSEGIGVGQKRTSCLTSRAA